MPSIRVITRGVASCRLEEAGVLTDCSIRTLEAEETLDFDFCAANVVNKVIMKVHMEMLRPFGLGGGGMKPLPFPLPNVFTWIDQLIIVKV